MFERPHHRRIGRVLSALDGDLLREANCLFGGGTAMALRFGEYRESVDMDFLVSDLSSYRRLRQLLTGEACSAAMFERLQNRPDWLERCMQVMAISLPKAALWSKIRALRRVLA